MLNWFKKKDTKPEEPCPKCGSFGCISLEEYQRRINITGAGIYSVRSEDVLQSCMARQQINNVKQIKVEPRQ